MIVSDAVAQHRQAGLLSRALAVTPNASQTKSKAPGRVGPRDMRPGYPLFAEGGCGAHLLADNTDYLDFVGANAAVPLGYAHPAVVDAVESAIANGTLLSLPSRREIEASELLCETVKTDRVRWVKTGSEAVTAAVKIARAATRRAGVIVGMHSYHGWHDWTLARFVSSPPAASYENGVPSVLGPTLVTYDYANNHLEGLRAAVNWLRPDKVAAIVIEPHRFIEHQAEKLLAARRVADEIGAVLIFDEIVYGFRWARAGGQEYFGVPQPDLSCYGKALGNGVPIACITGRSNLLDRYGELVTSTYGTDRIGLAAALAVLRLHKQVPSPLVRLWALGSRFWEDFRTFYGKPGRGGGRLEGYPVHWRILWNSPEEADTVLTACAERGVLFHRDANNACAAMTEDEVTFGAQVLAEELRRAEEQ